MRSSDEDDSSLYDRRRRGSIDSQISSNSGRWNSTRRRPSSQTSSLASRITTRSSSSEDITLNSDAKPLLRLALASSPNLADDLRQRSSSPFTDSDTESTLTSDRDLRYTIRPAIEPSSRDSFMSVPSFNIPSNNSLRLAKMERIRKTLGDDVPLHLVFPQCEEQEYEYDEETDSESSTLSSFTISNPTPLKSTTTSVTIRWRPLPPLPTDAYPIPRSTTTTTTSRSSSRLSHPRDSLLIQTSAPRQAQKIKRKPVPKLDLDDEERLEPILLPLPGLDLSGCTCTCSTPAAVVERRRARERLSLILPHEHDDIDIDIHINNDDDDDALVTPDSEVGGPSPISAWFSDVSGGADDKASSSDTACFQNYLNYEFHQSC
ncbi:hypothetical protein D9757_014562 [Collybiopsis confluens]|uniref:Uncharacterized protein n=1 Tax=Collybiopsis confluens TaxID=2823264 RepID=A0A8H5CHV7_9AGAR|nr:hypothetical protein D9757_014562 [Collybiopsis confluens]